MGASVLTRVHIHRLTTLLLTHVRRTRSHHIPRVERRLRVRVIPHRERGVGTRTGSARLGAPFGLGTVPAPQT